MFLLNHKQAGTNYIELWETSIESLQENADRQHHILTNIVNNLNQDILPLQVSSNTCMSAIERLRRIRAAEDYFYIENNKTINELRQAYDAQTDTIFYYNYAFQEYGWMVVHGETIKKKVILQSVNNNNN